jgi:uncharacterized repeat protein (TIGR02543 family)
MVASGSSPGDLSTWVPSARLALANEPTGDRPWLGELHLAAVYDRALAPLEIERNFDVGPHPASIVPRHTLDLATVGGGSVARVPDLPSYAQGSSVLLLATPDAGWSFAGWSGDLSGSASAQSIAMDDDRAVTATFVPAPQHTLSVSVSGGGSVARVPDLPTYAQGSVVALSAVPDPGWVFGAWGGDLSGTANPQPIAMLSDRFVSASFVPAPSHALHVVVVGSGSVVRAPDLPLYPQGSVVQLTATPSAGWSFAGWSGDVASSLNPVQVTVTGELTLIATFEDASWLEGFDGFAPGADPPGWLDTVANNGLAQDDSLFQVQDVAGERAFGTSSTQTNVHSHYVGPETDGLAGYEYLGRVRVSAASGGVGVTFFSDFANTARYYRLRRYGTSAFHFAPVGTAITGGTVDTGVVPAPNAWYRFRVRVEDTGARTEMRAKVWPDGAAEPAGWQAEGWDASAARLTGGRIGVWSFSSGAKHWDDLEIASLAPPAPTLSIATVGNGSVSASPDLAAYDLGQVVTLRAVPDTGHDFAGWSGDLTGTANPATITMDGDRAVTATFVPRQYALSVAVVGMGSVRVDPDLSLHDYGSTVTLTPEPAFGWRFFRWSGDTSGYASPLSLVVTRDLAVTATFTTGLLAQAPGGSLPDSWAATSAPDGRDPRTARFRAAAVAIRVAARLLGARGR